MALHKQSYTKNLKLENSKTYFDVFDILSKLRACSVSAVASGVFVDVGRSILYLKSCPETPGEPNTYVLFEKHGLLKLYLGVLGVFCTIKSYL